MYRPTLRRYINRNDDGSLVLNDSETILDKFEDVELSFDSTGSGEGIGSLLVTSGRIVWFNDDKSFDFDVPYIVLHAMTHDISSFPRPCLYCQLDVTEDDENQECFFVPKEEKQLRTFFDSFSKTAALNPDPSVEEEDDSELYHNVNGALDCSMLDKCDGKTLSAEAEQNLAHLESVFQFPEDEVSGSLP